MNYALANAAYDVCIEVRDGKWDEALRQVPNGQPAASQVVIDELRRRCPGRSVEEYQRALAQGMFNSRLATSLMSAMARKRTLPGCPEWVESGLIPCE
jgi:hypothetical protein